MLKRYPFDPTGRSTDNLVRDELHTLDPDIKDRLCFARYGGFFHDGLVIKQGERILQYNHDYLITFFWQDATHKTGKPVSRAIMIINPKLMGDITLTYQVVGGEYQTGIDSVQHLLDRLPWDVRNTFWDEVLEKPEAYFPERHMHHINDVFGLTRLYHKLEDIREAVARLNVNNLKIVYDRFLKLKQYVESHLETIADYKTKLAEALEMIDGKMEGYLKEDAIRDLINTRVEQERPIIQAKIDEIGTRLDQFATDINNTTTSITELTNIVNDNKSELETKLDQAKTEINGDINNLRQTFNNSIETLNNRITETAGGFDRLKRELNTTIDTKVAQAGERLKTYIDQQDATTLQDSKNYTDSKFREASNANNSAITELTNNLAALENTVNTQNTETNNALNVLRAKDDELDTAIANEQRDRQAADTALGNRIDALDTRVNETNTAIDTKVAAAKEALEAKIAEAGTNTDDTITSKLQELSTEFNRNLQQVQDQSIAADNELKAKLNELRENTTTALNTAKSDLESKIAEVNQNAQTGLNGLRTRIAAEEAKSVQQAETNTALENKINAAKTEAINHANGIETKITNQYNPIVQGINQAIDTERQARIAADATLQGNINTVDGKADANAEEIEKLKTKDTQLSTGLANLQNSLTNTTVELERKIRAAEQGVPSDVAERLDALTATTTAHTSQLAVLNQNLTNANNQHASDTQALQNALTALSNTVETNKNNAVTPQQLATAVSTAVDPITAKAEANKLTLNALAPKVAANERAHATNADAIAALTQKQTQDTQRLTELANRPTTDETRVNQLINEKLNPVNTKLGQLDIMDNALSDQITALSNRVNIVDSNLGTLEAEHARDIDTVTGLVSDLETKVNRKDTEQDNRLTALEARPVSTGTGEITYDEATLDRLVKASLDRRIAHMRDVDGEVPPVERTIILPDTEGGIQFHSGTDINIYPIIYMDSNMEHTEYERHVFTPSTHFEYTQTSTWTVPDIYDMLIAQVYVTTGIRGTRLPTGEIVYYPPSTKMSYVMLKGGQNVPITVGAISSFGQWLTNDGTNDKGTIVPTYPIVTKAIDDPNYDIRKSFGKFGRVVIVV